MSSNHLGLVWFPDGTVMVGNYSGTADVFAQDLITAEQWAANDHDVPPATWDNPTGGPLVEVQCWTMYGGGFSWRSTAACPQTTDLRALAPRYDARGEPEWEPTTDGTPEWVRLFMERHFPGWEAP